MTVDRGPRSTLTTVAIAVWAVIGAVILLVVALGLMGAVSELVLPLLFAVMIGTVAYPAARRLGAIGVGPAAAAALILLALTLASIGIAVLIVNTIVDQGTELANYVDAAIAETAPTTDAVGMDAEAWSGLNDALAPLVHIVGRGLLTTLVGGVGAVVGFVGSAVLSLLLMYYVLKDGPVIRDWGVNQAPAHLQAGAADFASTSVRSLRAYWAGRAVLSAVVTAVVVIACVLLGVPLIPTIAMVTFLGGFVPYLGAFIGGALAAVIAVADGGLGQGLVLLGVIVAANLLLENLLEPRVMSGRLSIHPIVVLIATTIGGVVGGLLGLVVAVPLTAILIDLGKRTRESFATTG